ncbi:DUF434 domain-containing protein [Flavobacterium sp. J27]|uniref:DUF434 domain-containing protein n=1 Tax=Flavobacterium sp. J27 TaxID=2060419 RepID=UPI001030C79E|nr:DUF434 domain-containing protein [Flavobacterium sp. J27]
MSKQINRGKEAKDDFFFETLKFRIAIHEATKDMHYLLTRGYSEKNALSLVGNRYKLASRQQKAVQGMSASNKQVMLRKKNEIQYEGLACKKLVIDGFNLLILLESALSNAYIFKGLDGCYRDLSSVHRNYKMVNQTEQAINLVFNFFKESKLYNIQWIFDKQVSNSGRIKAKIEAVAVFNNLNWSVFLEDNADKTLIERDAIVVSSDKIVLDHAKLWFNLAGYLIEQKLTSKVIFNSNLKI